MLPYGYAYGRATAHSVKEVLASARRGRVVVAGARGRSPWDRPGQAADLAIRRHTGEDRADALTVSDVVARPAHPTTDTAHDAAPVNGADWSATVTHVDGRAWRVFLSQSPSDPPRPESCGAALGTPRSPRSRVHPSPAGGPAGRRLATTAPVPRHQAVRVAGAERKRSALCSAPFAHARTDTDHLSEHGTGSRVPVRSSP